MEQFQEDDIPKIDDLSESQAYARKSLILSVIWFNVGIILLMSSKAKFASKFSKASMTMVILMFVSLLCGYYFDMIDNVVGVQVSYRFAKLLCIIFNFMICYQFNDSLNHGNDGNKYIKITFILSAIGALLLYFAEGNWRGSYFSNSIISAHTLKLLDSIKKQATSKGMVSTRLISIWRLEWFFLLLNCIVWGVAFSGLFEYESQLLLSIRTTVRMLLLLKMYIITMYFTSDSHLYSPTKSQSISKIDYQMVPQNHDQALDKDDVGDEDTRLRDVSQRGLKETV